MYPACRSARGRQLLEGIFETQSPDPLAEGNLSISGEPDEVKHLLSDVDADHDRARHVGLHPRLHDCFSCSTLASRQRLAQLGKQPVHPISGQISPDFCTS
jgi:hypothetical protein